jgi:hypothetical protein
MVHPLISTLLTAATLCDQPRLRTLRHSAETHLIITATAETRPAGEGVPPFTYADWQLPGSSRPTIFGQVVTVRRASGAAAADLRNAGRRAVLVPWDHDSGCQPIPWTLHPRWIPAGQTGFVAARLRPRDKWVDDMPTFDVADAWREPYSVEGMRQLAVNVSQSAGAIMTPEEYSSLYAALPVIRDWQRNAAAAVRPLRAWRDRNPTLAVKYPAKWVIATTLRSVERPRR